jgi:hypothetical protein|tara:strand:- start:23484 stop:23813 length:330 start_codon:yes stop_codon:yes gene_type:complete
VTLSYLLTCAISELTKRLPLISTFYLHRDLGVERYYGKFKAQGIDDVSDAKTLNNKQLDVVLEKIGMDCNPGYANFIDAMCPLHFIFFFTAFVASPLAFRISNILGAYL